MFKKFLSLLILGISVVALFANAPAAKASDSSASDCSTNAKTNYWGERSYNSVTGWGSISVRARVANEDGSYSLLNGINFNVYSVSGHNFVLDGGHQNSAYTNAVSASTHDNFYAPNAGQPTPAKYCDGYAVFGEGNADGWGAGAPLWGNGVFFDCTYISNPGDGLDIRSLPSTVNGDTGHWVKEYNAQWDNDSDSGNWQNFGAGNPFNVINGRNRFVRLTFVPDFKATSFLHYADYYHPNIGAPGWAGSTPPNPNVAVSPGTRLYFYFGYNPSNASGQDTSTHLNVSNANLLSTKKFFNYWTSQGLGPDDSPYASETQGSSCSQNCAQGGNNPPYYHFTVNKNQTSSGSDQQWGVELRLSPDATPGQTFCLKAWVDWGSGSDTSAQQQCYIVANPQFSVDNKVISIDGKDPGTPTGNLPDGTPIYASAQPGSTIQYQQTVSLPLSTPNQTDAENAVFEAFLPLNTQLVSLDKADGSLANSTTVEHAAAACQIGIINGDAFVWEKPNQQSSPYDPYNYNQFSCGTYDNGMSGISVPPGLSISAQNFTPCQNSQSLSSSQGLSNPASCLGNPNTPQSLFGTVEYFPRGGKFQIVYTVKVKPRNQVGVYPVASYPNPSNNDVYPDPSGSDGATNIHAKDFCVNASNDPHSYWTAANALSDCQDLNDSNSYQGVASYYRVGYNWDVVGGQDYPSNFKGWYYSEKNYVPVPGSVKSIKQTATCSLGTDPTQGNACEYQAGTNLPISLNVAFNAGGPVYYNVTDQCPASGGTCNAAPLPVPMSFVNGTDSTSAKNAKFGDFFNILNWSGPYGTFISTIDQSGPPSASPAQNNPENFNFSATFGNAGIGSVANNCAGTYWVDFSAPNHPTHALSACKKFEQVQASTTSFNTLGGDVHAGNTATAGAQQCQNPTPVGSNSAGIIRNGASAVAGQYLVTAAGGINVSSSGTGQGLVKNSGNGGATISCRPDLVRAANRYANQNPLDESGSPSKIDLYNQAYPASRNFTHNWWQNTSLSNGDIIVTSGDATLGDSTATSLVKNRLTLLVNGNLYIKGDVGQSGGSGSPSLGVIVTGNIYIDAGVNNLFGYYYTASGLGQGKVYTCTTGTPPSLPNSTFTSPAGIAQTCNHPLTIDGLLMANTIHFDRTFVKGVSTGSTPCASGSSECIRFTGNVVAAPPPGFNSLFTGGFYPPNSVDLINPLY